MNRSRRASLGVLLTLMVCVAEHPPRVARPVGPAAGGGAAAGLPAGWFMGQRLSGDGRIPVRARAAALEAARSAGSLGLAPGSWVNVGPLNVGGRVTALGVDPNDPNHVWLGSAAGGVFVSGDGGTNWSPVFDEQTALSIGAIAVHPTDSNVVYVGTGEDNGGGFSYDGEGVFKTVDGGRTWANLGLDGVRRIGRIAVDPLNPQHVFVAAGGDWFSRDTERGIYRSPDAGATWEKVLYVADDVGGIDVAIDPVDSNRIYAATWQRLSLGTSWYIAGPESGVYRSLDGGTTWSRLGNGLPWAPEVGRIGLAIARSSPDVVYALVTNDIGFISGLFRSSDAGETWVLVNDFVPSTGLSYYLGNIRVDPADPDTVYILDTLLLRSRDGGRTLSVIANSVHPDWHDLVITGRRLIAGNDAGFFRSGNGGSGWDHAVTLPITQFYDLGIDWLQPQVRFGGSQDNGTIRTRTGAPSDWQEILTGDGLQCEVDPTNSSVVYAEYQYGAIFRSANGGNSLTPATDGLSTDERTNWNTPITLDPVVPTTLYTGRQRVYRSTDSASSWSAISPDLTNSPGPGAADATTAGRDGPRGAATGGRPGGDRDHLMSLIRGTITAVTVSPVDHRVLWAGTDDGNVWVSEDAGVTWIKVNPPGPAYWVTDIACDPFDARTAYLTVTGYRQGDTLPYVRASTDLGATWRSLGDSLPQVPVNTVVADPAWRGRVFVGTDLGVHLSDDGGATWSMMRGGMPYVVVLDLVLHGPTRTLYAGTHGRSIYAYDLAQLPPPDGDGDGVDNNLDCAPFDASVFAPPGDVGTLSLQSDTLSWSSLATTAGPGTMYDVARGDIANLETAGTAGSVALACAMAGTTATDVETPATGAGFYYMIRGRNSCGAGSWGKDSRQVDRISNACP